MCKQKKNNKKQNLIIPEYSGLKSECARQIHLFKGYALIELELDLRFKLQFCVDIRATMTCVVMMQFKVRGQDGEIIIPSL